MATFDTVELEARRKDLLKLLSGYGTLAASPFATDPADIKAELQQGIASITAELEAVEGTLAVAAVLAATGYPGHASQEASQAVIDALAALSEACALVPKDFKPPVQLADALDVTVGNPSGKQKK